MIPNLPHRKESPLASLLRNPIKPSDYCAYPVKSDQPSVRLLRRQCRWCIGEMKKAGGGRIISREWRKTDDETKEKRRKEGGIMGIERQTLTRLISAPAVYPQFLSRTLKLYMEGKTYDVSRIFGEGGILMEGSITYKESDKIESFEEK